MGFRIRLLQVAAAMKMMMIPTILMVAYLATNILSKTYLVETASRNHGYWLRRQHSGSDYIDGQEVCLHWEHGGWSRDCPIYINEASPDGGQRQECKKKMNNSTTTGLSPAGFAHNGRVPRRVEERKRRTLKIPISSTTNVIVSYLS